MRGERLIWEGRLSDAMTSRPGRRPAPGLQPRQETRKVTNRSCHDQRGPAVSRQ